MEALSIITLFTSLLLTGILLSILSNKLNVSNVLFLIITGLTLGSINEAYNLFNVSEVILVSIAIIALALIVFDGSSRFTKKTLDEVSFPALKLVSYFTIINIIILSLPIAYLYYTLDINGILFGATFAIIMAATDPAALFSMMKKKTNKVIEYLQVEAIFNTPITILAPLILVDFISGELPAGNPLGVYANEFFSQILIGIGAGVLVGLIFFKIMKHIYNHDLSPLALITSALLSYTLSEQVGGSGILSVAVLGITFGSMSISKKETLKEYSNMISSALEIIVFLLLGFIININLTTIFILKSLLIFTLLVLARYISVRLALNHSDFTEKEKLFMTLNFPKGIGTAVLLFSLSVLGVPQIESIISLSVMIIIYSVILATIANEFSQKMIRLKINS